MVKARMQLTIPSELTQVRFLGLAVRAVLVELACSDEQIASIELCLVEAVNNVIEHAYREEAGHSVGVALAANHEELELAVSDSGRSIPAGVLEQAREAARQQAAEDVGEAGDAGARVADALAAIDLEHVAEGGYGLRLICQVMDQVSYQREGARNTLTLTMKLAGQRPPPSAEEPLALVGEPRTVAAMAKEACADQRGTGR